ncbi:glycosylhydrolase, partial [gut metagenome]
MTKKRNILLAMTSLLLLGAGCQVAKQQDMPSITLNFTQEHQVITGFGVSEADYADDVFAFPKRQEILDALFAPEGLKLNILRGEIFPHYSTNPKHRDFAIQSDTSWQVARHADQVEKNELLRRGQFWLTAEVHRKYPEVRFTFSTWSPPAWMKKGSHATPNYPASQGKLKKEHFQTFADYLADFCQAYQQAGIQTYAISPSNEPGYAAPWNSCLWSAEEMGTFIVDYLLPTFAKRNVTAKVLFGENPAWSTVFDKLSMISSADFVNEVLTRHPTLDSTRILAAGHGYVLPDTMPLPAELRQTPIIPFKKAVERKIPMWVTEISDITPLDTSMEDGLYWAKMFRQYLMEARVSAIIYWLGAQPTTTNESLLVMNRETGNFISTKRYDTFGNYSRYIPVGSHCIGHTSEQLPDGIFITTSRKGQQYTMVIVNTAEEAIKCQLKF